MRYATLPATLLVGALACATVQAQTVPGASFSPEFLKSLALSVAASASAPMAVVGAGTDGVAMTVMLGSAPAAVHAAASTPSLVDAPATSALAPASVGATGELATVIALAPGSPAAPAVASTPALKDIAVAPSPVPASGGTTGELATVVALAPKGEVPTTAYMDSVKAFLSGGLAGREPSSGGSAPALPAIGAAGSAVSVLPADSPVIGVVTAPSAAPVPAAGSATATLAPVATDYVGPAPVLYISTFDRGASAPVASEAGLATSGAMPTADLFVSTFGRDASVSAFFASALGVTTPDATESAIPFADFAMALGAASASVLPPASDPMAPPSAELMARMTHMLDAQALLAGADAARSLPAVPDMPGDALRKDDLLLAAIDAARPPAAVGQFTGNFSGSASIGGPNSFATGGTLTISGDFAQATQMTGQATITSGGSGSLALSGFSAAQGVFSNTGSLPQGAILADGSGNTANVTSMRLDGTHTATSAAGSWSMGLSSPGNAAGSFTAAK